MATSLKAVVDLAGKVIGLGDKLFLAHQTWNEYKYVVERLESTLKRQEDIIKDYNLEAYPHLNHSIKKAKDVLNNDIQKLEEKLARRRECFRGFTRACAFPESLRAQIQFIKDVTTDIERAIPSEAEQRTAVASIQDSEVLSTNREPDSRFVLVKGFQAKVYNALSDFSEGSCPVVFLHGEQGIGKSTFALHVVSEASKKGKEDGSLVEDGPPISFHLVIFKDYRKVTSKLKKDEEPREEPAEEVFKALKGQLKMGGEASDEEFLKRLGETKTLIILDDVQDSSIPARIVGLAGLSSKSVKFLITSNRSELCDGCDNSKIKSIHLELKDIDEEEARHILAKHTGLTLPAGPAGRVPEELQGVVGVIDKVVKVTGGHPLALVCFAGQIEKDFEGDVDEWEGVRTRLDEAMKEQSKAHMFGGDSYRLSFWAVMQLTLTSLGKDAQNLLLLSLTLRGKPVVEQAVELLYQRLGLGNSWEFRKATGLLRDRYIISVRVDEDTMDRSEHKIVYDMKLRTWYVHPLMEKFVKDNGLPMENKTDDTKDNKRKESFATVDDMGRFIRETLQDLGDVKKDTNEEHALLALLCTAFAQHKFVPDPLLQLYFKMTFSPSAALLLLARPYTADWTEALHEAAKKMILHTCVGKEVSVQDVIPLFRSDIAFASTVELVQYCMSNPVLKAECELHFLLEVLAEGKQMGMTEKNVHKLKRVQLEHSTGDLASHGRFFSGIYKWFDHTIPLWNRWSMYLIHLRILKSM